MPSDDFPPDALKRLYELEDSSISPVGAALAKFGSALPLPSPLDKVFARFKDHLASDEKDRIKLLAETVTAEARKHDERMKQLEAQVAHFSPDAVKDLLLDAAEKRRIQGRRSGLR